MEETDLHRAITDGSGKSLSQALRIIERMTKEELLLKSQEDTGTFLHLLVSNSELFWSKNASVMPAVPIIYKLALSGLDVNARNIHGNTALHIACFKPHAEAFIEHLIRIGLDPCLSNRKGCKVIHSYSHRLCQIIKGQPAAKSGFWSAVDCEDLVLAEKYLKMWCRVKVKRATKTLKDVCEDTGSTEMMNLLNKYELMNEMVCAAMAGDTNKVSAMLQDAGRAIDLNTKDHSFEVPKPLVISLQEIGQMIEPVITILLNNGFNNGSDYADQLERYKTSFEESQLFAKLEESTVDSYLEAIQLLQSDTSSLDLKLRSHKENTKGWTYLHYVCHLYKNATNIILKRLLIRIIYNLALAGIDVNIRDSSGESALIKAFEEEDQTLLFHILRIGVDPSIATPDHRAVAITNYKYKGKFVLTGSYRRVDQPGLWVAVEDQDLERTRCWADSWARVNVKKNDRSLKHVAMALENRQLVSLLEESEHTMEFVCAVFACHLERMKKLLALGRGKCLVNPIDPYYIAGFKTDYSVEYVQRPLIIPALEICTPEVIDFLIQFGADLGKHYEATAPCGPAAFWAFRDDIDSRNTLVVAQRADVTHLRDERGATMLHLAVKRKNKHLKEEIVRVLLERDINIAARDIDGLTARDYLEKYGVENAESLRSIIDEFVIYFVTDDQIEKVEQLILEGYDHILDIQGVTKKGRRMHTRELAEMKQLKDMIKLLDEIPEYEREIKVMHSAIENADIKTISKKAQEKRIAWGTDRGGRSLMHKAIVYEQPNVVDFLSQQFPNMVYMKDNLLRTPLHYCASLKDKKKTYGKIWSILSPAGGHNNLEANNLTVHDYLREMEKETPKKEKPRGRQFYDYKVRDLVQVERQRQYFDMTTLTRSQEQAVS
ncbi:uncharacterized protein LOC106153356 isoform X2 [Lingula anatina]|nr:uncharacterized protein LOC106153356 isoform X2 [Lingula anatina]|eukprot:XP_013382703.1 uncharacterized protein LOC106153356 isoform X2 [Lingula anatina]